MYPWPARRGPVKTLTIVGGLLTVAGILLYVVPLDYGTIPQWNSLCSSGIGQLGQLLNNAARQDCGVVSVADHLIGTLIFIGAACLIAAFVLAIRSQSRPAALPSMGLPGAAGYSGHNAASDRGPDGPATAVMPIPPGMPVPWLRRYRTAVIIAVVAAVIGAGGAWTAVSATSGTGRLLSYLCWNGPGDNGATLLQWPSGSTVSGTYRTAELSGTAPDEQLSTSSGALTGTVTGPSVSLDFAGSQQVFGQLGTSLTLQMPQQDGSVQPITCKPGTTSGWNTALGSLSSQASSDNAEANQQQQQQNISNAITQAEQQLASDIATLTQDATTLDNDKTLAGDIQQMQNDYATEQAEYQTELGDSCPDKSGDASTVGGDASTVGGDLSTLQGDISTLQANNVSHDLAAVQSDTNTITNLGGTPNPDPSSAIAEGNKALSDLNSAIAWATSNGNSINSQAQQLATQAQAAANC
jgi:hypothetical protein